jgi:hypothetical protein
MVPISVGIIRDCSMIQVPNSPVVYTSSSIFVAARRAWALMPLRFSAALNLAGNEAG